MGNCISDPKYRIAECDIIRGILIVFVVIGHSGEGVLHDIIFLFHMPLFFLLSGFLLEGDRAKEKEYLTYKAKRLLIPYVGYLLVDFLLVRRDYSMNSLIHAFYGGRACSGVYWYITCSFYIGHAYATQSLAKYYWIWETNIFYNRCRNSNLSGDILWRYSLMRKLFGLPKLESKNF